jgi:small subunit ribosomal protein S6
MFILPAEADEATVGTAVDRITKVIEPGGGAVASIDRWGRKRFAYEIADQNEGYYVVVRFTAEPTVQSDLDRVLKLADEVVRHKVLIQPPAAPKGRDKDERKTKEASPAPA